jgi:UDP-N-acetylmuramate: L-alanyl-gamma-D-glutamyl-meso-diaminopimelate ligase
LISGIAWDHINVFPTFENYVEQFDIFCSLIEENGTLIYNEEDTEVLALGEKYAQHIQTVAYQTPCYSVTPNGTKLTFEGKDYNLAIFGAHNLQNMMGAMRLAESIGIRPDSFFEAIGDFTGAGKRLQKVAERGSFVFFKDFAHSPSKLKATTKAVKEQFSDRRLVAFMELHTFSSLKKEFLPHYAHAMDMADEAVVYFSHDVVKHKKLEPISTEMVKAGFGGNITVLTNTEEVLAYIRATNWNQSVLLMMSSGTFDGINYEELGEELLAKLG